MLLYDTAAERVTLRADQHYATNSITDYIDGLPRAELGEAA